MHNLGQTRGSHQRNHLLLTPDTFVRTTLPGMQHASAIVHINPALGAAFAQYTAEFETNGDLGGTPAQRFVYVTEGTLTLDAEGKSSRLVAGDYCYVPQGLSHHITAAEASRATVIEKSYQSKPKVLPPSLLIGSESQVASHPLGDDPGLQVRCLLPDVPNFDFAVNTMVYQPGAALSMVEMHVMEHGLIMLEGGGIYRLGDHWYAVNAGDFIWMGPWCPQWFGAIGKIPAKYLIYKDWNRHPLS